nr:unnamed protein product [Digitaria exilis]
MLLGFISLLLTVLQGALTQRICVSESVLHHFLPCPLPPPLPSAAETTAHYGVTVFAGVLGSTRRLLAGGAAANSDYCEKKTRNWKHWEEKIQQNGDNDVVGISWYLWALLMIFLFLNVHGWYIYIWLSAIPFIVMYGFKSCIMGEPAYVIARLVIRYLIKKYV